MRNSRNWVGLIVDQVSCTFFSSHTLPTPPFLPSNCKEFRFSMNGERNEFLKIWRHEECIPLITPIWTNFSFKNNMYSSKLIIIQYTLTLILHRSVSKRSGWLSNCLKVTEKSKNNHSENYVTVLWPLHSCTCVCCFESLKLKSDKISITFTLWVCIKTYELHLDEIGEVQDRDWNSTHGDFECTLPSGFH